MSSGNASMMAETTQDFHCCCSITRSDFDANGTTGVHIFNSIVLILTSISATLGNLLVLVSIWRTPSLHSPSNVLLFGLAVSDLGIGLIVEPVYVVYNIAKLKGLAHVVCISAILHNFTCNLFCFASLLAVTAISVDMYIALYLHLRYKEIVTVKRMTGVLVGILVCGITVSLFYLWYWHILWTLRVSLSLLCLLVTASAYYRVFRVCRHHQVQLDAQAQVRRADDTNKGTPSIVQRRKSLMNKFLIYCLFVLCYLHFVVMTVVVETTHFSVTTETLFEISHLLVFINSTLNPFVYCWRFRKIRVAVIKTTKKILRQKSGH